MDEEMTTAQEMRIHMAYSIPKLLLIRRRANDYIFAVVERRARELLAKVAENDEQGLTQNHTQEKL